MPDFPITANDRYFTATASAAQTVFTPDFPLLTVEEVIVKRTRGGITTTLVPTTHYAVSGLNQAAGFTVTLTAGAQAGDLIEFFGNTALVRQSDYPASQALRTEALNADLDRAVMRDQEARRDIDKLDVKGDILDARDQAVAAAVAASASASAASASQTAAAASMSSAATSATNAGNSATAASASAGTATTQASNASASAGSATTQANNASASAGSATTQANNASASASSASTAATNAINARIAAEAASTSAIAALADFTDRYLGERASDPTVDLDGSPLDGGELYVNTVSNTLRFYTGTVWITGPVDPTGLVLKAGDTMEGPLTLPGDPTNPLHAAPKQYVDARLLKSGDMMTGKLTTIASASGGAGLNLPHGAAPSAPVNGDVWSTTAAFFGRLNGTTVQLATASEVAARLTKAGDTMTGKLTTIASASGGAGLNLPHGAAPSAPVNGDLWSTTSGFFGCLNGTTAQLSVVGHTHAIGDVTNLSTSLSRVEVQCLPIACSDETTALTTGAGKVAFHMPYDFTLTEIFAGLTTAQASGSTLIVDVNMNGTSIMTTSKLVFDNTEETTLTAATPPVLTTTALTKGVRMTIDIDQVGNGSAKGLKVYLIGKKT